jgi:transcription elongation factor GreA
MTFTKVPMTQDGHQKMKEDLKNLIKDDRPAVIKLISSARALGDLKENAEYHSAKEKQGHIEARIAFYEDCLSKAQVIDISDRENDGRVVFGATVTLINLENQSSHNYRIVGEHEADVAANKISVTSPVARAIVGKFVGDHVGVETPEQKIEYQIEAVDYKNPQ